MRVGGGRAIARCAATCVAAVAACAWAPSAASAAARKHDAPKSQLIDVALLLRADLSGLARYALAVNTEGSPYYGQYEPVSELASRFGASPQARRKVLRYLRAAGAREVRVDGTGLFADATISVGLAERLFRAPLDQFRAAHGARFIAPAGSVQVPSPLRGAVSGVVGLDTRPLATPPPPLHSSLDRRRAHSSAGPPTSAYEPASGTQRGCSQAKATSGFTPNQYLTAYGFDPLRGANVAGQGERVALIEVDGAKRSDVFTFARCFGFRVPRINAFGVGVKRPLKPGGEATLDLEVLDAAAPGLSAIDVYEAHPKAVDGLKAMAAPLQHPGFKPQVISASLGLCEPIIAGALGARGVATAEGIFSLAAASGITFLSSSGDSGSAGCNRPDGVPFDNLAVSFPASSPWVTGVGGTNLVLGADNSIGGQMVWNDTYAVPGAAGGGGASDLFRRPSYQRGVVGPNRRAVPDVSMLADVDPGYAVFCSASDCVANHTPAWQSVGGTSAAAPLLAGGLALVDQWLRMHERQDLGFVNPLLYRVGRSATLAPKVLWDVVRYGNDVGPYIPGDRMPLGCCQARAGFDEASGWGSVNVASLAGVALAAEPMVASVSLSLPAHQHPVRRGAILATVGCSRACRMGAFAEVTIGRSFPFAVFSRVYRLGSAGKRTIAVSLSPGQRERLRAALSRGQRIFAQVFGATVNASGVIQKETGGKRIAIRG